MCLASRPAPPPPPPAPPPMPPMPTPPPAPPAPPPAPVSAGQKVATIQSRASTKSAMRRTRGASFFSAPGRKVTPISGTTTGLNVPMG